MKIFSHRSFLLCYFSLVQAEKLGYTDVDEYCMGRKRRGTAIIINNKDFHPSTGLNTRDGTNLDATRLEGTFLGLGFETEVFHNRTALQILSIAEQGRNELFNE